tara:strand:+ start:1064 stop:1309 length:246 start_codon:yes stop_codon:yes gene_type:complete
MAYEQKEGDVMVFDNGPQEDKKPRFTGKALVGGKTLRVALWPWQSKDGKSRGFSGEIEEFREKPEGQEAVANKEQGGGDWF